MNEKTGKASPPGFHGRPPRQDRQLSPVPAAHLRLSAHFRIVIFIATLCLSFCALNCRADVEQNDDVLRKKMVEEQLKARGIKNPQVLQAMSKVERHQFVPDALRKMAYADSALPIGEGQTISQPYIVAWMTEVINPQADMKVLEIGTGSGYQAAILAELCHSVYTIEIIETLAKRAEKILGKHYQNVHVRTGDGYQGWPEAAPFDAILVTCAPTKVPAPLAKQLKEGGRMVIPVGNVKAQELYVLVKRNGRLEQQAIIPVLFVPMLDKEGEKY
ncbi:MAG TPA: protein-L-isoaspartate(D-aspartate) O-methyltransferase [Smithella sp.]|nr:protein-L-isoaspartate(D-aspartate) O-methyltransferase [Smithella sp.]